MTQEEKAKAYDEAIERAKEMCAMPSDRATMEYVFPELKWSEDEQVRNLLIGWARAANWSEQFSVTKEQVITWLEKLKDFDKQLEEAYKNSDEVQYKRGYDDGYLEGIANAKKELEKQGKCEADCPQNHQDVNRPNGCITMEDFNGGEGFYKLNIEYLNKRQVEEIEEIVRTWNKDADCDLCTSKEHCISIEKQSKQDGWTENDENIYQKYIIEMLGKIDAVEYESYSKIVDWIDSLRLRLS